jgi:hypothetical protein
MTAFPEVQETGERMVFLVRSDSNPLVQYRVDLLYNDGAGGCACRDFKTRRQPNLDAGEPIWTKRTSCKHSRRAAWHVIRQSFPEMAAQEDRQTRRLPT